MSQTILQFMHTLSSMHQQFSEKDYQLSSIDKHAIQQVIEQLHVELLLHNNPPAHQPNIQPTTQHLNQASPASTNPAPITQSANKSIEEINQEMTEVFENQLQKPTAIASDKPFQLGINERIMFAKELFDDDVTMLQESMRKLRSFGSKEDAFNYFEKQFSPFLLTEGKDEEIIQEFGQLIHRLY